MFELDTLRLQIDNGFINMNEYLSNTKQIIHNMKIKSNNLKINAPYIKINVPNNVCFRKVYCFTEGLVRNNEIIQYALVLVAHIIQRILAVDVEKKLLDVKIQYTKGNVINE